MLGTSQQVDPGTGTVPTGQAHLVTYEFSRVLPGEALELTREVPNRAFLVTVRADDLGPEGVVTTASDKARFAVTAAVTTSDIAENVPAATLWLATDDQHVFRDSIARSRSLIFQGTCQQPGENAPCQAAFDVVFGRDDDGLQDGTVHIEWALELTSTGQIYGPETMTHEAQDPPWTVEIVPQ